MTASQIEGMGLCLVDLLSSSQLEAAAARYNATIAQNQQFLLPMTLLRTTWRNHFHRCMRMPAGGAQAGGSMQTGFEMEMLTATAVHTVDGWVAECAGAARWPLLGGEDDGAGSPPAGLRSCGMGGAQREADTPAADDTGSSRDTNGVPAHHGHLANPSGQINMSDCALHVDHLDRGEHDHSPPRRQPGQTFLRGPARRGNPGMHRDMFKA